MNKLPEPDHVDFLVGDVEADPQVSVKTMKAIEEFKRRPGYRVEAEEAERILTEVGIDFRRYGMQDAKSLLEHWHRCIADRPEAGRGDTNGVSGDPNTTTSDKAGSSSEVPLK